MSQHWSDKVTVYWDFSLGPLSFLANLMLVFIILKYTPETTKTYSSIILAVTISDCIGHIGNFMTSPRVLPRDPQLFMVFRGACTFCFPNNLQQRSQFCLFFYALQVQLFILNHFILVFSYVYRMSIIVNPFKKIDNRKAVYSILCIYSSLHFCYFTWVWYACLQPIEIINQEITKYLPDIVGSGATYVFNILSVTSYLFAIVIAVICKWRIYIFTRNYQYSEALKNLHRSLEMVFSAQAMGPFLSLITGVSFVALNQMGVSSDSTILLENLMSRPAVLMYMVNPIVTIYFIAPYRTAFRSWFCFPSNVSVGPLSVANSGEPIT
ncbi:hypothetical protein CAEBREN_30467 [Caenorhabditis brenneri]|uniref:Uncharacterized protein n=1 Tax=Caenorhabditis brenneri TaxID=135651 RepID=G0NBF9_CAEBE|nr:hypothetical protein CAEBREN_30467 [Caenorhabditis brenneri]